MLSDVFQPEALDPKIMLHLTYGFWTMWFSTCSFITFCFAGSILLVNKCLAHLLPIYATASYWSLCIVYKFLNLWYIFKPLWKLIHFFNLRIIYCHSCWSCSCLIILSLHSYCALLKCKTNTFERMINPR